MKGPCVTCASYDWRVRTGGPCDLCVDNERWTPADVEPAEQTDEPSALDRQVGGDHYQKLGDYQPWAVLQHWLTPEEFRGYMKGTAIAYLARERDKGGMTDVDKAAHTLQALLELARLEE